jgi:Ca-activated chloride channel family protein
MLLALCWLPPASGDAGVLVPVGRDQPDSKIFSLDEMTIDIRVENGDAHISIHQIFGSHTNAVEEGTYTFALPVRATVSDFAVWDGLTRIPGVILERRRAEEIYESLKQQTIDPGLLQQGEHDAASARRSSVFSVHIVPIPAFGTKRVEMEYHERVPVEALRSALAVPLRPDAYQAVTAGILKITVELDSRFPLRDFQAAGTVYPLHITERTPNRVRGAFEGRNVALTEDFTATWELDPSAAGRLEILTYRNPLESSTGFFQALHLLPNSRADESPRTIVALFDTSLSMQWEKLERSYRALDQLLHSLRPADRFNLLLFNSQVTPLEAAPLPATAAEVEKALAFVKSSSLRGGTDLESALQQALAQPKDAGGQYLVLISDCGATQGAIRNSRVAEQYSEVWKRLPPSRRPRTYIFGVGDDANLPLMGLLAANDGLYEWVRSTEPIELKLDSFLAKLGKRPVDGLALTAGPKPGFDLIYPLEDRFFPGSVAAWVGQYRKPGEPATFQAGGASAQMTLPAQDLDNQQLPRTWARARVDALLAKIEREGEDRASIDEIIRLSRKYKFVTPYTSFLAAPRALLRPRVIRPGDPVIRVKTDPAIESVVAIFPFGLTKPLRYLKEEDTWQTRFLAPADLADGAYPVRLILRDRDGRVFRESKTFVIASTPPVLRVRLPRARFRPGDIINIRVNASSSARTIVARMYGAAPVDLRWNQRAGASTGDLSVPNLPPGKYQLTVIAEDVAHNIGTQEVTLEILP